MEKVWVFHRATEGREAGAMQKWFRDVAAPRRLADSNVVRYSLNLGGQAAADPAQRFLGRPRPLPPTYEVAEELWLADAASWAGRPDDLPGAGDWRQAAHAYRVASTARIDRGEIGPCGLKQIALIRWRDDIAAPAAEARWAAHAALVDQVHPRVQHYAQDRVLATSPGAPGVDGVGVLHYPNVSAYESTFDGDLIGYQAIQADTAGFVAAMPARLLATEHRLRG